MTKILLNKSNIDLDYPICRPSLDLDFTQEELDPRITFSRGSIGTRVNRNRLIETVPANQPRFDYDPVTGECKGLLIEESRQNLFTNSNDFTVWTKQTNRGGVVGITTNAIISPDGTTNASRYFVQTGGGNFYSIYRSFTAAANTYYTYSVFAKAGEFNTIGLVIFDGSNNTGVTYNIGNGTIVGSYSAVNMTVGNLSIINYGNGWYRCIFPFSHSLGGSFTPKIDLGGTSSNYGVYIYGAQLEAGVFPTSYIPTGASTVTRSADVASMTGTNFSSWYNSREGTIQTNIAIPYRAVGGARSFALDNGTVAYMLDLTNTSTGVAIEAIENSGYRVIVNVSNSTSIKLNQTTTYSTQPAPSQMICVNGTLNSGGKTYLTTSNYSNLRLGGQVNSAAYLNGTISRLTYYPRALKPNQLVALTQ